MDLANKPTKELRTTLKAMKSISIALIVIIVFLFSVTIYGLVFKENQATFLALFVVGISCGAILPLQFSTMKKIKTELKNRE
jgi:cyanate permease